MALKRLSPGRDEFRNSYDRRVAAGVELTATFASLIAVGDILLVGTTIMEDALALSTLTNAEKMQATVGYGLSERYTQLRALMQVGVGNTAEG